MDDAVEAAGNATLLDYAMATVPSPLQASPSKTELTVAEIQIPISNGTEGPVYCKSITFVLPVGDAAKDLVSEGEVGSIKPAITPSDEWEIESGEELGEFVAKPKKDEYRELTEQALLVQLRNIKVNAEVGSFEIFVEELSNTEDSQFSQHDAEFQLAKFPYGFTVSDFRPTEPQVKDGEAATLKWRGSDGANYTIFYGSAAPVDVTKVRQWTTPKPPGLHVDTTFILKAWVMAGSEPIEHYLSTTVTVADPDLRASSLDVTGESTLQGATNVGSGVYPSPLTVSGSLKTHENLEAAGHIKGASFGVPGAGTVGSLTVAGILQALGGIQMKALGQPRTEKEGAYLANSDGFVLGTVIGAGIDPKKFCWGWIDASYPGAHACASGGNVVTLYEPSLFGDVAMGNNNGSFLLPVPKGASYTLRTQKADKATSPAFSFVWISLGAGPGEEAPTRLGDVGLLPLPPEPEVALLKRPDAQDRD